MEKIAIGAALALGLVGAAACTHTSARGTASPDIERGRYLVESIGCTDCHTPKKMGPNGPEPDRSRLLSGHPQDDVALPPAPLQGPWMAAVSADMTAWAGPWGVSYTSNLTPDRNTGIGIWTERMFIDAIRTGRHMGVSRPILPPMPWQAFRALSDDDLKSIFAYLTSLPPVSNHVPDPLPPPAAATH